MAHSVKLRVFRFDPDTDKKGRFETFELPAAPGLTVLGALLHVHEHIDSSLAFRSSCRAGVCGSCAMNINGHYALACETQVARLSSSIRVRPLAHLPIVKDLYVDMTAFWDSYRAIKPYLIPGNKVYGSERFQTPDERARIDGLVDCILCGCCHAACPFTGTNENYLGPAALLWADRFLADSRDGADRERIELTADERGVWRCHTVFNCSEACPKDLDPAGAIADLKRKALGMKIGRRP